MKNKIKIQKGMTNHQKSNIDWIISVIKKSNDSAISSVNVYFKEFDINVNYKIKIKLKNEEKRN